MVRHKSGGKRRRRERKPIPDDYPVEKLHRVNKPRKPRVNPNSFFRATQKKKKIPKEERTYLQPLGVYLEEIHKAKGWQWPPQAYAEKPSATREVDPDDKRPSGSSSTGDDGPYLVLTTTHDGRAADPPLFSAPFFSIPLPDGGVCVADCKNHRLCLLSGVGEPTVHIGVRGRSLGEFTRPVGLALAPDGTLLVADDADRIQRFDEEGVAIEQFGNAPTPPPEKPPVKRTVWLPPGTKGPPDDGAEPVRHGDFSAPNPPMELPPLIDMPDFLEARDREHRARVEYGPAYAATVNLPPDRVREPYGVAVGPGGRVYVSDKGHDRIACFAADGAFAFAFSGRGRDDGFLRDPRGLTVHRGRVYVADMCNHRIARFSLRGRPLDPYAIGRWGDGAGELRSPSGVAISRDLLLVSEWNGGRVQVLTLHGQFLHSIRAPFCGACVGAIAADESGRCTVTDSLDKLHCLSIVRRGERPLEPLPPDEVLEPGGGLKLEKVRNPKVDDEKRKQDLRHTRDGRLQLAMEGPDFRAVVENLTQDDMAAIIPLANKHAEMFPEKYVLPPVKSPDALAAELEAAIEGRAGPLGPPH